MSTSVSPATRRHGRLNRHARQDGATIAEFVLVVPFALLIVLALIQLGLMYAAKQIVNEGAFLAARAGAVQNARQDKMTDAMAKALIPFYQNTADGNDFTRLQNALRLARNDPLLKIEILNPTPAAFADFGITSDSSDGHTYIPNDNLEYRPHDVIGQTSGISIQDANALKIKVTYGYELKVPLMRNVINSVMCGILPATGLAAFDGDGSTSASGSDCTTFYQAGRVPIVSYATVQMQTPAFQN